MQIDKHKTKQEIFSQKKVTLHDHNVEKKANGTETLQIVIEKKIFSAQWKKEISKTTKNTRQGFWFITLKLQTSGELQASFTPQFFHGLLCHF